MATLSDLSSLADWVYTNHSQTLLPSGWNVLKLSPLAAQYQSDVNAGFYAAAFQNTVTGEIVIASRGSENRLNYLHDVEMMSAGVPIPEAQDATKFIETVARDYSNATITLTGHSLGGYAAQVAMVNLLDPQNQTLSPAARSALTTVTFNAPGLSPSDLQGTDPLSYNAYNFNTQSDWVHLARGTQLGQSRTIAEGPTLTQEFNDFKKPNAHRSDCGG